MPDRRTALHDFAEAALGHPLSAPQAASADASFRSYWRLKPTHAEATTTWIVMDAPPGREDISPWLDIGARLHAAGLHTPAVLAVDHEQGFVLMEDLGQRTYLPELTDASVDHLYSEAMDALLRMQRDVDCAGLPAYDESRLLTEMELLPTWFLDRHLGRPADAKARGVIDAAFAFLADAALAQPQAFVHRDYHSRNLLIVEHDNPAIIDFQDAVKGPLTYDLVSLLRDCYVVWDRSRVERWALGHARDLRAAGLVDAGIDDATFLRWFDLMGVQRHLKVLGIFCRLWYRDGKAQYLDDLPRVWNYVRDVGRGHVELHPLLDLIETALAGRDLRQPRTTVLA